MRRVPGRAGPAAIGTHAYPLRSAGRSRIGTFGLGRWSRWPTERHGASSVADVAAAGVRCLCGTRFRSPLSSYRQSAAAIASLDCRPITRRSEADKHDAAYIYVVPRGPNRSVARTKFCDVEFDGASINVGLDSENRIVGFEILGANKVLPEELLAESQIETG